MAEQCRDCVEVLCKKASPHGIVYLPVDLSRYEIVVGDHEYLIRKRQIRENL